jgi:hypothetical protein
VTALQVSEGSISSLVLGYVDSGDRGYKPEMLAGVDTSVDSRL